MMGRKTEVRRLRKAYEATESQFVAVYGDTVVTSWPLSQAMICTLKLTLTYETFRGI